MTVINTILVDDEQNALDSLEILLSEYSFINILHKISNPIDVFPILMNSKIDLIFLDIKMPTISGIDLLEKIRKCNPHVTVVMVTAFENYSMKAVNLNASGYLLKPVNRIELGKIINNIESIYKSRIVNNVNSSCGKIFIKSKNETLLVEFDNVVYFEADGSYSKIYLKNGKCIIASSNLGSIISKFPKGDFIRLNRSLIVSKNAILSVNKKDKKCLIKFNKEKLVFNASVNFFKKINLVFENA